jgi:hypothetical protein
MTMTNEVKQAFKKEMGLARNFITYQDFESAWHHLERAHILGQRSLIMHVWTHLWMLRVAVTKGDGREIRGQIIRLITVVPGYLFGWVPTGNTGGTSVSALSPMPIPNDLEPILRNYRVWADVTGRLVLWGVAGLFTSASFFAADVRARSREARPIVSHYDGVCKRLSGVNGPEDIVVNPNSGQAYAVGGDRRSLRKGGPGRAHIWAISTNLESAPVDVTPSTPEVFRTFGMDIHREIDGTVRLFVVNRAISYHGIEVFRVESDGKLKHERTLTAPNLVNPNDVVAIDSSSVYVTLDKKAPAGGLQEVFEGILRRPTGRVALVTPNKTKIVASGLLMANGITFNTDRSELYVAETVGRSLSVFDIGSGDGSLRPKKRIAIKTNPDNLTLAENGHVLVAGHQDLFKLLGYQLSERNRSPSEVIALDPETGHTSLIFADSGQLISGSSVAVQVPGTKRLLIGSSFAPYALSCDAR